MHHKRRLAVVTDSNWTAFEPILTSESSTLAFTFYPDVEYGVYQNGPQWIEFNLPVNRFTSAIMYQSVDYGVLPDTQRVVAYDATGRILIDTVGGLVTTIARDRMTKIGVYPVLGDRMPWVIYQDPDTFVVSRQYQYFYRPDSSCPPLSDDSLLNVKQVTDALISTFRASKALTQFKEGGVLIFRTSDSSFKAYPDTSSGATSCTFPPPLYPAEVPLPPGAVRLVGLGHSHAPEDSVVYSCPQRKRVNGVWTSVVLPKGTASNQATGYLSPPDWSIAAQKGLYVYSINDQYVARADIANDRGKSGKSPRWRWDPTTRCLAK